MSNLWPKKWSQSLKKKLALVAYERIFETEFDRETKQLFSKWLPTGGGCLREVVARRELTVLYEASQRRDQQFILLQI